MWCDIMDLYTLIRPNGTDTMDVLLDGRPAAKNVVNDLVPEGWSVGLIVEE